MKDNDKTDIGSLLAQLNSLGDEARRRLDAQKQKEETAQKNDPGTTVPETAGGETIPDPDAAILETIPDSEATEPENKTRYDPGATLPDSAETIFEAGNVSAPPTSRPIETGSLLLDTYRVEGMPIHGGMGTVWRVRHTGWDTDLAMKRPKAELFQTEKQKENFINECSAWIDLGLHPNIVSCYYVREIDGVPSIFSEWMDGGSLRDALDNGTLYEGSEKEQKTRILDIAIQFARGLHYAHNNGLIHQDVKPDNLLMTKSGDAKVADFGISRARAVLTTLEDGLTGQEAGKTVIAASGGYTPAYCSMEQMNGEVLTRRTDIYSWAVSVLEMLLGTRPWTTGVVAGLGAEGYMENARVTISPALKDLLLRCLAEQPKDRPHDFGAVEAELLEIYRSVTGSNYTRPAPKAAEDIADSQNNRALSYADLGMEQEALDCWDRVLEQYPSHALTIFNRALFLWETGRATIPEVRESLSDLSVNVPEAKYWTADFEALLVQDFSEGDDISGDLLYTKEGLNPFLGLAMRGNEVFDAGVRDGRLLLRSRAPGSQDCRVKELPFFNRKKKWTAVGGVFSRDGSLFAVVLEGGRKKEHYISVYRTEDGTLLCSFGAGSLEEGLNEPEMLEFSPDNLYLSYNQKGTRLIPGGEQKTESILTPHIICLEDGEEPVWDMKAELVWGFLRQHDPLFLRDGNAWIYSPEINDRRCLTRRRLERPITSAMNLSRKELFSLEWPRLDRQPRELFDREGESWKEGCSWIADRERDFSVTIGGTPAEKNSYMLFWDRRTGRNTGVVRCVMSSGETLLGFDGRRLVTGGEEIVGRGDYHFFYHRVIFLPEYHWRQQPVPYRLSRIASVDERLDAERRFLDCRKEFQSAAAKKDWRNALRVYREALSLDSSANNPVTDEMYRTLIPICRRTGIRRITDAGHELKERWRHLQLPDIFGSDYRVCREYGGRKYIAMYQNQSQDNGWPAGVNCYDSKTHALLWSIDTGKDYFAAHCRPLVSERYIIISKEGHISTETNFYDAASGRQIPMPQTLQKAMKERSGLEGARLLDLSPDGTGFLFNAKVRETGEARPVCTLGLFSFCDGTVQELWTGDAGTDIDALFLRDGTILYTLEKKDTRHVTRSGFPIKGSALNRKGRVIASPGRDVFYQIDGMYSGGGVTRFQLLLLSPDGVHSLPTWEENSPPAILFTSDGHWMILWPCHGPLQVIDTSTYTPVYSTALEHSHRAKYLSFTSDEEYIISYDDRYAETVLKVEYELENI